MKNIFPIYGIFTIVVTKLKMTSLVTMNDLFCLALIITVYANKERVQNLENPHIFSVLG